MVRGVFQQQCGQHLFLLALWETGKVVTEFMVQGTVSRQSTTVHLSPWSFCETEERKKNVQEKNCEFNHRGEVSSVARRCPAYL